MFANYEFHIKIMSNVRVNKNKLRSLKSSEHINEKMDGPYSLLKTITVKTIKTIKGHNSLLKTII